MSPLSYFFSDSYICLFTGFDLFSYRLIHRCISLFLCTYSVIRLLDGGGGWGGGGGGLHCFIVVVFFTYLFPY